MIRYRLTGNTFAPNGDQHVAAVQPLGTKTMEQIVEMMISHGSTVTKAEALSVIEELSSAIAQSLRDGYNVVTPLCNLSVSIMGVFGDSQDTFDPAVHKLKVRAEPGVRIREIARTLKVQRIEGTRPMPVLNTYKDISAQSENDTVTPGGVGHLLGSRIAFDVNNAEHGVFFTTPNGVVTKVQTLVTQSPSEVIFVVPPTLPVGEYWLSVRTVLNKAKEIREGYLQESVFVR